MILVHDLNNRVPIFERSVVNQIDRDRSQSLIDGFDLVQDRRIKYRLG